MVNYIFTISSVSAYLFANYIYTRPMVVNDNLINTVAKELAKYHPKISPIVIAKYGYENAEVLYNAVMEGDITTAEGIEKLSRNLQPISLLQSLPSIYETILKASIGASFVTETIAYNKNYVIESIEFALSKVKICAKYEPLPEHQRICYEITGKPLANLDNACLITKGGNIGHDWIMHGFTPLAQGGARNVVAVNLNTNDIYQTKIVPNTGSDCEAAWHDQDFFNYYAISEEQLELCGKIESLEIA